MTTLTIRSLLNGFRSHGSKTFFLNSNLKNQQIITSQNKFEFEHNKTRSISTLSTNQHQSKTNSKTFSNAHYSIIFQSKNTNMNVEKKNESKLNFSIKMNNELFSLTRNYSTSSIKLTTEKANSTANSQQTKSTTQEQPNNTVQFVPSSYTLEEVAKHNKKDDFWIVIHGKVYDVTSWVPHHPGQDVMMEGAGLEATQMFEDNLHSAEARAILEGFEIGTLKK